MNGLVLAEAVQIDGGVVLLFVLVLLALFLCFIGLCWAAYKAGAGNRVAQIVVGLAALYLVANLTTSGLGVVGWTAIPLAILAACAAAGRVRSRR